MRTAIVWVALTACFSTTSRVTVPAEPSPVTIEIEGDCDDARRTHPDATHCQSETHLTGAAFVVLGVTAIVVILPILGFLAVDK